MKKFIPFKKEIPFKSQIAEITSISLEHNIHKSSDYEISGDFIVSGEYKATDTSVMTQEFKFDLPFEVSMSDIYDIDDVSIDIDDFYYELKNMEVLEVNITLLLDNIKEKPLIEPVREDVSLECYEEEDSIDSSDLTRDEVVDNDLSIVNEKRDELDSNDIVKNENRDEIDSSDIVKQDDIPILTSDNKNVFSFTDDDEEGTYIIYIVRDNDTIESVLEKYGISIDLLKEYNDISDFKRGDKLIIPNG